ncbi:hypothetical protein HYX05_01340 [Candidatus Woesearchaeota archaeon]|nr:hypothetical protein [Candidatus Woesearchaeota archaeon]
MAVANHVSDSSAREKSIDSMLAEIEKKLPNLPRGVSQLALPGLEDCYEHLSGPRFFIISKGRVIDGDLKQIYSPELVKGVEEIEINFDDAVVVCFRKMDYRRLSSLMRKKARDNAGITPGWGINVYSGKNFDCSVFTYGRNPERVPAKY